jgi:hypothetical protein
MTWWLWLLGVTGNIAFAYACLPTAWSTWRAGKSIGTPVGLAWNILIACLLFYGYMLGRYGLDPFLLVCSATEIGAYGVVIRYHYFPRLQDEAQADTEQLAGLFAERYSTLLRLKLQQKARSPEGSDHRSGRS